MNKLTLSLLLLFSTFYSKAQSVIHTEDIDNFWMAYDSVKNIKDLTKQIEVFKRLYNDKGSEGLKAFMEEKHFSAQSQVFLINKLPKFWESIRPRTLLVNSKKAALESGIAKFKEIYPYLTEAKMYYCIGDLNSGGTTQKDKVLIGTEIVMCNNSVDYSEFPNNWLKNFGSQANDDAIVTINIHEYAHSQQNLENEEKTLLLGNAILEGSCDFIAHLVVNGNLPYYIPYYLDHEAEIWSQFQQEKHNQCKSQWIGTGSNPNIPMVDLGYAVGYAISKHYYGKASDKTQAIKDILTLAYEDVKAVDTFLQKSGYEEYMSKKGYQKPIEYIEGYTIKDDTVTFVVDLNDKLVAQSTTGLKEYSSTEKQGINSINLAGNFNNWNRKDSTFQLQKINDSLYQLSLAKDKLGKKGETKYFKFVINGKYWVEPKFKASNKGSERDAYTNLYIKL